MKSLNYQYTLVNGHYHAYHTNEDAGGLGNREWLSRWIQQVAELGVRLGLFAHPHCLGIAL